MLQECGVPRMHGEGGQGGEQRVLPPAPVQEGRHTLLRSAIHNMFLAKNTKMTRKIAAKPLQNSSRSSAASQLYTRMWRPGHSIRCSLLYTLVINNNDLLDTFQLEPATPSLLLVVLPQSAQPSWKACNILPVLCHLGAVSNNYLLSIANYF